MKLSRKSRWLIILALIALLTVGSAGVVMAAGHRHLPRFSHIAPDNLISVLRHRWRGHDRFPISASRYKWRDHDRFGSQTDLIDKPAIEAAVAKALGVNPDELKVAAQEGRDSVQALLDAAGLEFSDLQATINAEVESQLAAAVEAGTLTQDEMDAILSHDHGRMDPWGGYEGRFGKRMWPTDAIDPQTVLQTAAANAGLDEEELMAALTEGRSAVDTFLEANDTTLAEFRDALDTAWQQAIADAVEAGTLTEEQADHLNRKGGFGQWFGGGRHHGRHGHGWQRGFGNLSPTGDNA